MCNTPNKPVQGVKFCSNIYRCKVTSDGMRISIYVSDYHIALCLDLNRSGCANTELVGVRLVPSVGRLISHYIGVLQRGMIQVMYGYNEA
jgi:hypothetical protein